MTIRYTCDQCGSVLKIKDDKAGTSAKCPKCKTAFTVPSLDEAWDGEIEFEKPEEAEEAAPLPPVDELPPARKSSRRKVKVPPPPDEEEDGEDDEREKPVSRRRRPVDEDEDDDEDGDEDEDQEEREKPVSRRRRPVGEDDDERGDTAAESSRNMDDDPDMPLELTPEVASENSFDPTDVLRATTSPAAPRRDFGAAAAADRKASVADMMREFEASKKKDRKNPESSARPATVSAAQTAGTAAEALSRAYQQKRDNAANPKAKTAEVNVERELMIGYLKQAVPAVLGVLMLAYGLYSYMNRTVYTGAPLAPVYGVLTRSGDPMVGYTVRLVPLLSAEELSGTGSEEGKPGRSTASGVTSAEGTFSMMYTIDAEGATIGDHTLEIVDPSGLGVAVPAQYQKQTVPPEGIESLRIDLP